MTKLDMTIYLTSIAIVPHPNPKSGRTMFMNAINHEPIKILRNILQTGITILYRGKGETGRIIIGPKDFHQFISFRLDLETITEEDLKKEFERTYPKELMLDVEKEMLNRQDIAAAPIRRERNLKQAGEEVMDWFSSKEGIDPFEEEGKKKNDN